MFKKCYTSIAILIALLEVLNNYYYCDWNWNNSKTYYLSYNGNNL